MPDDVAERVRDELLESFRRALGWDAKLPEPTFWRVQLWGAALPINAPKGSLEYILDPGARVAVTGDWLQGPPSVQAAALSADALADAIAELRGCAGLEARDKSVKLTAPFVSTASASTALGDFPKSA